MTGITKSGGIWESCDTYSQITRMLPGFEILATVQASEGHSTTFRREGPKFVVRTSPQCLKAKGCIHFVRQVTGKINTSNPSLGLHPSKRNLETTSSRIPKVWLKGLQDAGDGLQCPHTSCSPFQVFPWNRSFHMLSSSTVWERVLQWEEGWELELGWWAEGKCYRRLLFCSVS